MYENESIHELRIYANEPRTHRKPLHFAELRIYVEFVNYEYIYAGFATHMHIVIYVFESRTPHKPLHFAAMRCTLSSIYG